MASKTGKKAPSRKAKTIPSSRGDTRKAVAKIQAKVASNGHDKHSEVNWLSECMKRGTREIFAEIRVITPEIAERLLEVNKKNRHISDYLVRQIANDIIKGQWQLNGETVIVSREGLLNDGQNRLTAIILAGKPAESFMVFGVAHATRTTVDMGRQRTTGNFLHMEGVHYSNEVAATIKLLTSYKRGIYASGGSFNIGKQDILTLYHVHAALYDSTMIRFMNDRYATQVGKVPLATAYLILRNIDRVRSETFFEKLLTGAHLPGDSPILFLRQRLLEAKVERRRAWEKLELILRYWLAYANNVELRRHIEIRGEFPKLEKLANVRGEPLQLDSPRSKEAVEVEIGISV